MRAAVFDPDFSFAPAMPQVAFEIVVIFFLLLANGVLALAEMSLVSARKARLRALASGGSAAAARALALAESPNRFLSTTQIGITLVGIVAGAFGGATLARWLAGQFSALGVPAPYAESSGFALVVLGITYLSLIVGELVPKRLALAAPERWACRLAGPMGWLSQLARPAVKVLGWSTDLVLRLLGTPREAKEQVTDEEVSVLMREGQRAGVFHQAEPQMVERVLELDDLLVKEIMTPRPKVVFLARDDAHEQLWHKIVASRHSHFPVYEGNRDHIVGTVSVKSIYANLAAGTPVRLADLMTDPLFVPETQTVVQLLESFRQSGRHFAIVADEFGSVVGVATLVDVLEAIVGEVPTQEERARAEIRPRDDGTWLVDGTVDIETLEARLPGLRFAPYEERTYQTLAGFVLEHLGHVPAEGETFTALGWTFEIIDMDRPRIDKVLLRPVRTGAG
jgi:putative hemolysin